MKRGRYSSGDFCSEENVDELYHRLIGEEDVCMSLPSLGTESHLLSSKVRKHYFETVITQLCLNYEHSQKLPGKNLRMPSAIWRCAKQLELQAVQACMLMQLYRQNILAVIKQVKADTDKGKLHKNLYEYITKPPSNDKTTQTNFESKSNMGVKKRKFCNRNSKSDMDVIYDSIETKHPSREYQQIPTIVNGYSDGFAMTYDEEKPPIKNERSDSAIVDTSELFKIPSESFSLMGQSDMKENIPESDENTQTKTANNRLSIESVETEDEVMLQMEKLFQTDETEDDIFDGAVFGNLDIFDSIPAKKTHTQNSEKLANKEVVEQCSPDSESLTQTACLPIPSLDERIAQLSSVGILTPVVTHDKSGGKPKEKSQKPMVSKWICELYFQRAKLCETMDNLIENNRRKHDRIKLKFLELFGEDDEEYHLMSPMEDTPDFVASCNSRVAPFVVKYLTKYYRTGRIKSKALFKAVARNIIDRIVTCDKFPDEFQVFTFVTDFFKARPIIRCNADFQC